MLDQLPLDYELTLYNSSGAKLAVSQLGGTSTETIIRNTASAATYYVKVVGFNGAFISTSCYNLLVNTSGSSFRSCELTEYVEGNVNLEKVNSNSSFIVFPNPVQDVMQLNFISDESSIVEVKLMDLMGKVIETKTIEANDGLNNAEMNTSFLENGVYMIRLTQDDEVQVRKFIVKH